MVLLLLHSVEEPLDLVVVVLLVHVVGAVSTSIEFIVMAADSCIRGGAVVEDDGVARAAASAAAALGGRDRVAEADASLLPRAGRELSGGLLLERSLSCA